jgi:hypothetical protein
VVALLSSGFFLLFSCACPNFVALFQAVLLFADDCAAGEDFFYTKLSWI